MTADFSKEKIRSEVSVAIRAMSEAGKSLASDDILRKLSLNEAFRLAGTILLYHSLPDEPSTHTFIGEVASSKKVLLPAVRGNDLILIPYQGDDNLRKGRFHIMEPPSAPSVPFPQVDVAVIPGRAFDLNGVRIGRGAGYYDRLLHQRFMAETHRVGICFDCQIRESLPATSFDVPMHEIITENRSIMVAKEHIHP